MFSMDISLQSTYFWIDFLLTSMLCVQFFLINKVTFVEGVGLNEDVSRLFVH